MNYCIVSFELKESAGIFYYIKAVRRRDFEKNKLTFDCFGGFFAKKIKEQKIFLRLEEEIFVNENCKRAKDWLKYELGSCFNTKISQLCEPKDRFMSEEQLLSEKKRRVMNLRDFINKFYGKDEE